MPLPKYLSIIIIDPHVILLIGLGRSGELTLVKSVQNCGDLAALLLREDPLQPSGGVPKLRKLIDFDQVN